MVNVLPAESVRCCKGQWLKSGVQTPVAGWVSVSVGWVCQHCEQYSLVIALNRPVCGLPSKGGPSPGLLPPLWCQNEREWKTVQLTWGKRHGRGWPDRIPDFSPPDGTTARAGDMGGERLFLGQQLPLGWVHSDGEPAALGLGNGDFYFAF